MNKIVTLTALLFVFTVNAQELDLNSAIQLAKTNNRTLQNVNLDIKKEIAHGIFSYRNAVILFMYKI